MAPRSSTDHIDNPMALGARLRGARQAAGFTQKDLSFDGCTPGHVSLIEGGSRTPSLQVVHRLAGKLGVNPHWLAKGVESAEGDPGLMETVLDLQRRVRLLEKRLDGVIDNHSLRDGR